MKLTKKQMTKMIVKSFKNDLTERGYFKVASPIGGFITYYENTPFEGEGYSLSGYHSHSPYMAYANIYNLAHEVAKNRFRNRFKNKNRATWLWYNT